MQLKDQVAIVTGAASPRGIGWATAKRFADEGARVVILDLDAQAAEQAAGAFGPPHLGLACDVRDESACRAAVQRVLDTFSRIDILVNNARCFMSIDTFLAWVLTKHSLRVLPSNFASNRRAAAVERSATLRAVMFCRCGSEAVAPGQNRAPLAWAMSLSQLPEPPRVS